MYNLYHQHNNLLKQGMPPNMKLTLSVLPGQFAICRLDPASQFPIWSQQSPFLSITRTAHELSIVCDEQCIPIGIQADKGWCCLAVNGPLELTMTGILAALANVLAHASISIFALSTYDTDFLMVKSNMLELAIAALQQSGFQVM